MLCYATYVVGWYWWGRCKGSRYTCMHTMPYCAYCRPWKFPVNIRSRYQDSFDRLSALAISLCGMVKRAASGAAEGARVWNSEGQTWCGSTRKSAKWSIPFHYSAVQGKTLQRLWDSTARQTVADERWHMLMLRQHHPKTLGIRNSGWDRMRQDLCASFHIAQELWHLSRIAKGAALSGTLGRHQIYSHVLWQRLCAIFRFQHFECELVQFPSVSSMWKYVEGYCGNIYCGKMKKVHIFWSWTLVTVTSKLMSNQLRKGPNMLHPILAPLPQLFGEYLFVER